MPQHQTDEKNNQWNRAKKYLRNQFHYESLRPGQEEVIRADLDGKNALAIMPTGAGKSLCYQLPAALLTGTTIVISPLISLMKDQLEKVEEKGMAAVELNSTITKSTAIENLERITNESAEILYVTPERFSNAEFLEKMKDTVLDFVVIDEAHCVSQWGHDFRPAYLTVGDSLKKLKNPPVLALTATATEEVAADIQKQLGLTEMQVFRSSVLRPNLNFEAKYLNSADEKMQSLRMCRRYGTFTCLSNKIKIAIVKAMQVEPGILLRVFLSGEADCATYYFLRLSMICWLPYSKSKMRSAQVFWASLNLRNR